MAINANTTQSFVPIKEVRDGIVILKDGSLRSILLASSINLSLKSYDEQQAIISQFQNFLNSLDFSIQISVQSRKYDIRPYLLTLENKMKEQNEPLLKIQTREYISFIRSFTEQVNIMTKNFFIVVPYDTTVITSSKNPFSQLFSNGKSKKQIVDAEKMDFEEKRSQLDQRISVIEEGLGRINVRTQKLGTEEVVELFYKIFNPGDVTASIKIDGINQNQNT